MKPAILTVANPPIPRQPDWCMTAFVRYPDTRGRPPAHQPMDRPRNTTKPLRREVWSSAIGLLILTGMIATFLFLLPDSVEHPIVDLGTLPPGEWTEDAPIYVFFDDLTKTWILRRDGRPVLKVVHEPGDSDQYGGFGVFGSFDVPFDAAVCFEWRGSVDGPPPSLHIVDGSPQRVREDGGEVYTFVPPRPTRIWKMVCVPFSDFERDPVQSVDTPNDGILDTQGISNIELGLETGTVAEIELSQLYFSWRRPRTVTGLALFLGWTAGLVLLLRNLFRWRTSERSEFSVDANAASGLYPAVAAIFATTLLRNPTLHITPVEAFLLSATFVLLILDDIVGWRIRRSKIWDLRYIAVVSCAWCLSEDLAPLLPGLLLFLALLVIAIRRPRLFFGAAGFAALAVMLQPPIGQVGGKGLALLAITIASALALGVSWFVQDSEIRLRHRRMMTMYWGILEQIDVGVVLLDPELRIELVNRGFERLLGVESGDLLHRKIADFLFDADGRESDLSAAIEDGARTEFMLINPETGMRRFVLVAAHLATQDDLQGRFELIVNDISDRKRMERELERAIERLQRLSATDELTGLGNRRAFADALVGEWARCLRSALPLTLLYCDLDGFKAYNDRFGHPAGDTALRQVADSLTTQIMRAGDRVVRYGGEEFVILLPDTSAALIADFARKVRLAVESLGIDHPDNPASSVMTISIGVASCVPREGISPDDLIRTADAALYQAKRGGRNQVVVADEIDLDRTPTG